MIGLEMYPYTEQEHPRPVGPGLLTEKGFVELSRWYDELGLPLELLPGDLPLRPRQRLPMFALNTPREVVRAVREKGLRESDRGGGRPGAGGDRHRQRGALPAVQGVLRFRRRSVPRLDERGAVAEHVRRAVHVGRDDGAQLGAGAGAPRRAGRDHGRSDRRRATWPTGWASSARRRSGSRDGWPLCCPIPVADEDGLSGGAGAGFLRGFRLGSSAGDRRPVSLARPVDAEGRGFRAAHGDPRGRRNRSPRRRDSSSGTCC